MSVIDSESGIDEHLDEQVDFVYMVHTRIIFHSCQSNNYRSMRYGPLPRRPESVKSDHQADPYYYVTPQDAVITEEKKENDKVEKTVPHDYGYMEFNGDHCSHEQLTDVPEEKKEDAPA